MTTVELPPEVTQDRFRVRGFPVAHGGMIAFLSVVQLSTDDPRPQLVLPLVVATIVVAVYAARRSWSEREADDLGWRLLIWATLAALWVPLVAVNSFFLQAMFTLFPLTFVLIPIPLSVFAAAVPPFVWGVVVFRLDETIWEWLVLPGAVWALSCLFSVWITRVIVQSEERAALLAELAATRAELADAERAAGIRSERDRMAREIHDTLAQGFTSIVLHSRGALASGDGERGLRTLELVEEVASEHLAEARRLVSGGSATPLGDRTLIDALRRVAEADEPRAELHVDGDIAQLSGTVEVGVLRIVQEAVANARKHAEADRIDVSLARAGDQVLVDIVDDGRGFDLGAAPERVAGHTGGQGLPGLRARVEELSGSVEIESDVGAGTSVSVALPAGGV